ncbi:Mycobacterium rhizamassiliense ORFan [Mycobacterium rhizamassiliense]|uniref:Mycobacterium rhizamassiliense ORFan n=1 Tax=Mycobacterium rhizamassiliense TaxID=1841860 RepID=A0A2U3P263_9MYCO|nr:Mycobacterium rhizamassiliense ORFan [Mycobacterium rhizamassiliense]
MSRPANSRSIVSRTGSKSNNRFRLNRHNDRVVSTFRFGELAGVGLEYLRKDTSS